MYAKNEEKHQILLIQITEIRDHIKSASSLGQSELLDEPTKGLCLLADSFNEHIKVLLGRPFPQMVDINYILCMELT